MGEKGEVVYEKENIVAAYTRYDVTRRVPWCVDLYRQLCGTISGERQHNYL